MTHELSGSTRALLAAAKRDAPSAAARGKIWNGVVTGTAAAGAAGPAEAAKAGAQGLGGTGLVAVGTLFGSAITVCVALAVLHLRAPHSPAQSTIMVVDTPAAGDPASPHPPPSDLAVFGSDPAPVPAPSSAPVPVPVPAPLPLPVSAPVPVSDPLARESQLVAEARGALLRGDARLALLTVRAARAVNSHALEPEELSLEARALRALGRDDDAEKTESKLRVEYPDHTLAH